MNRRARRSAAIAATAVLIAFGSGSIARAGAPQFVIDGATTVTVSAATSLVLEGDLLALGTLSPRQSSAVMLSGYGAPSLTGVSTFAGLTLALHGTATLSQPAIVSDTLLLSSGWLSLEGHDLRANVVLGGSPASYVMTPDTLGRLVRSVGAGLDASFPVGDSHYDPVTLRTQTGADDMRVAVLDALPTQGITPNTALTRAWAIGQAHPGTTGTTHASVQWSVSEQGPQFDRSLGQPASALAFRWDANSWLGQPGVRQSDNGLDPAIDVLDIPEPGLWTLAGPEGALAVDPPTLEALPATLTLATPAPQPVRVTGALRYALPRDAEVTLALYDVTGACRAVVESGRKAAGWHVARLDASRVADGVYFLRLTAGRDVRTTRCVVLR